MKDHLRILGSLFIGWAALQVVSAVVLSAMRGLPERAPALFALTTVVLAIAYGWTGFRLRLHDRRVRVPAIILCALALLSFPFGTAIGAYGLWVLIRGQEARVAS
jgi:hypothetical protein